MMKIWRNLLLLALLCPVLAYLALPFWPRTVGSSVAVAAPNVNADVEMRGIWVSTVINLDYPAAPTASEQELKKQADEILDNAAALGFNTVFLQVRPCADAFYQSDLYPWSIYLTGTQGEAPENDFDPLAYWVAGAHQRGLELHAWINPYRVTRAAAEWDKLAADNPAKMHPEWVVKYKDNYYFDPGIPAVRQLVIDGVEELLENYAVDGIHMDDYFYPGTDFDDAATYAKYGAGFADIGDWRRDNVNQLVQGLHKFMEKNAPKADFGISPAGIWASKTLNPAGSNTTSTYSSYYNMYADTKLWVEEGWLDYIAPQIYWERGHKTADFTALLDWWCDVTSSTGVKLYIGLADYKTLEAKASDNAWFDGKEIAAQMAACAANEQVAGTIHFRYGSVEASPALKRVVAAAYTGSGVSNPVDGNTVSVPGEVSVLLDGEKLIFDVPPYVESSRVMLPMRVIFEALGATVDYNAGKITAQKGQTVVRMELGSDKMQVAEEIKTLDVPARAQSGRTLLPLRAVSEALGCKVDWNNATKTVTITTE
ncbi:MAG TPA: family 10 glycosylhydrolase [Candidatus Avidehalobacter gallistercoris]|uniref:Family 10 glycosylhydrolase n=1 Tax=Candidatus Avidehalobacter gallistercoris TaxID=2840694 RepID=A0A9D1HLX6_9FIRM|nr:family 10 glycosylhydrolase [Candidatus Avidehalobacter gallistercoris]